MSEIPSHSSSFHDHDGAKFTITMNVLICDVIVANRPNSFFKSRGVRAGVVNKASRATVLLRVFESEIANTSLYKNYVSLIYESASIFNDYIKVSGQ